MGKKNLPEEDLQKLLDNLLSGKSVKQAIMKVESGDSSCRWSGVAAESTTGPSLNVDSPFFLASIDKLYNACIIMLLCEQGKLRLNDFISDYLPNNLLRGLHVLNGTDHSAKLKIRHLLSHSSGLADWLEDSPKGGSSLIEEILKNGDRSLSFTEILKLVSTELKPHFPPQDLSRSTFKVRYSDTNYILLIAIIENICRKPLHEVHENLLYKPLSLNHTYFPGFSEPMGSTPIPLPLRADGEIIQIPEVMKSFRGIYSTTSDTIAFLRKLTRNEIFQKKETFAQMHLSRNRFGLPLDRAALRSPGWPIEYGLGIMRFQLPRIFTGMKLLPPIIGHSGSTGCWLFWCPELDMYFSGSVDEASAGALPYRLIPKILEKLAISNHLSTKRY